MPGRLLIADHYDSPAFARLAEAARDGEPSEVFLLGGSPEWFAWRYPELAGTLARCRFLDAAPYAAQAHALVNEFVVQAAERIPTIPLGGMSLLDLLRDQPLNAWWYLQTSEKGPYRTPLIGQLYRLALVRLVAESRPASEIRLSIREEALVPTLGSAVPQGRPWLAVEAAPAEPASRLARRPLLRLGGIALRAFARFVSTRLFCLLVLAPPDRNRSGSGRWAFTVFPSWWARPSSLSPVDRFLTQTRESGFDGYLTWLMESRFLWRHAPTVRRSARALRLVALQRFLSLRDGLQILSPSQFRRLRVFETRMRPKLSLDFVGFDVGRLFGEDIGRSLSSQEPIQDRLMARAVARAAATCAPKLLVYRAEFQPFESAILVGLGGRARAIGFHHHPFGRNYPQMHFTPRQIRQGLDRGSAPDVRPLPDGVIAIGPALARNLADGGFPADRIQVCGPQRYGPLMAYRVTQPPAAILRQKLGLPPERLVLFVALAIVEADTEALFGALVTACRDIEGLQLVIKTHPNRPKGDPALHATLDALGRERAWLMPDTGQMYDYIAAADCMLCIGSMIAFEAMALGIMPIVFDNPSTYGSVSLAAYADGLFNVRSGAELRAALDAVRRDLTAAREKRGRWPALLADVLGDLERPLPAQMHDALGRFAGEAAPGMAPA